MVNQQSRLFAMPKLSLDITGEILARLKGKDAIQYKIVCKSWNSLISSDRFVTSHLNYNLKKNADNNEIGDTRIVLAGPPDENCEIVGSSCGLVCVRFRTEVLVVNPLTCQVKKLESLPLIPDLFMQRRCMGFGYDSSIDDYKVLIGFTKSHTDKYHFLVLSLKTNVWNSVALDYICMYPNGVLCNGAIHWLAVDRNRNSIIVSFDLSKEVFKEIPTPMAITTYSLLGTIKDRLCIFRGSSRTPYFQRELWLMKNYNVQESESIWEQILSPPPFDDSGHETMTDLFYRRLNSLLPKKTIMDYIPHKSFSGHIHIWMVSDSRAPVFVQSVRAPHGKSHIFLSTISECKYNYNEYAFVESLVSPHGMGNDNGNCNEGRVTMAMGSNPSGKKRGIETNGNECKMKMPKTGQQKMEVLESFTKYNKQL